MELIEKQGFKKTETGFIPNDWEIKEFGELSEKIIGGGTPSRSNKLFWGDEIPWATVKDFATFNPLQTQESITREGLKNSSSHLIPKGVIITSTRMALGKAVIYDIDVSINQDLKAIYPKKNVDTKFFYYWFQFNSKYIEDLGSGSTVMGLSLTDLKKIQVKLPSSLSEQKAIATALSDVDALISQLEALIAKKKAIKQGAMQELLTPPHKGGKRLPGFTGEWVEKVIGKIGNTYGGLSGKSKKDFEDGKHPYITFLNVMNNVVIDTSIFEYVHIKSGEQQNKARKGDLFFNTSSETPEEVGMCAVLNEDVGDLYLNSFCFGFRLKEDCDVNAHFFSYLINSSIGRNLFLSLAQGATRYNLSKSNFNKLTIEVPSVKEQVAIAEILSDIDKDIVHMETKKAKYQSIKHGMMQELLTGKTRLV